ncbi:MAG TPA: class F sortase [Lacisediminihabitans sp.]|uniref:class F sortase n=1 Tax=Lacisediminihabitans sp. TaxID=2787631 RepID=UPI002EDB0399
MGIWIYTVLALAAAAALAVFGIPLITGGHAIVQLPGPPPAAGIPATVPPEPAPGQPVSQKAVTPPIAGQPLHLRIPAVGLDAVVGRMSARPGSTVDPPTPASAYWLSNYGVAGPAATNTVYIAGHTCRGRCSAVFSPLLDIPQSTTTVHPGEQIIVGTPEGDYTYTITDTELYEKVTVQQQSELWKIVPGRLVLVTCFQYNGGTSSQQNFVVYAQLDT